MRRQVGHRINRHRTATAPSSANESFPTSEVSQRGQRSAAPGVITIRRIWTTSVGENGASVKRMLPPFSGSARLGLICLHGKLRGAHQVGVKRAGLTKQHVD